MTKLRLLLLATTALTAMQFAGPSSHAQTAPLVVAQAQNEVGPDGKPKPKEPPKAAPAHPAPPKAAPPPHPAPPPPPRPTPPKPAAPPAAAP
ncbi:MAG: OmpA family protein, partial [Bradyrhizobium sp.]|nr:OmpA family protein [Bradyrhizobium sp.]